MNVKNKIFVLSLSDFYSKNPAEAQRVSKFLPLPFNPISFNDFVKIAIECEDVRLKFKKLKFFDFIKLGWSFRKANRTTYAHILSGDVKPEWL